MSYLDQLKKQVQARQTQEWEARQQREQQAQRFFAQVKPALEQSYQYLSELVEQLNYLKPDIPTSYDIKGFGKIEDFQPQNYRVVTYQDLKQLKQKNYAHLPEQDAHKHYNFFLRFECLGRHFIRFEKRREQEMILQKQYLAKHRLRFTCTEKTDENYKFMAASFVVEPRVPIEFEFLGNLETCVIDLTVRNFGKLDKKVYTLIPQELDSTFLDELAKYIVKKPNELVLHEKNQRKKVSLSEQQRDRLKFDLWLQKIQREQGVQIEKEEMLATSSENLQQNLEEFDQWLQQQAQPVVAPSASKRVNTKSFFQKILSKKKNNA